MSIDEIPSVVASRHCHIHGPIGADAPAGLCPCCLLRRGLKEKEALPVLFDDYELLALLGKGGMGVVYRARHVVLGREVALKRISDGALADAEARRRFGEEARIVAGLRHPNIVPIHEVGEHEGQPYFTMDFMAGGTLHDAFGDGKRPEPRRAAALFVKLARAVSACHGKGVIHRDLKPVNILFHEDPDEPYIADFGVAKYLDNGQATLTNALIGSMHYIAPEQRPGHPQRDTPAADVWSLGIILYELLAGRKPFDGKTTAAVLCSAENDEPEPLYRVRPEIGRDLASICHMCLRKEPKQRYISAEALAEDLERYLSYKPVLARDPSRARRIWWWSVRNPTTAGVVAGAAIFLLIATVTAVMVAAALENDRRKEVRVANEYIAQWVAGTVLNKLKEYDDYVVSAAGGLSPDLLERLRNTSDPQEGSPLESYCSEVYQRYARSGGFRPPFDSWFILDRHGVALARWPRAPSERKFLGKQFDWRDYFRGAWERARRKSRSAYVSRAFKSEAIDTERIGISSPIYDNKNEPIGVIVAMTDTGATLGELQLGGLKDPRHIAAIAAPRDNERKFKHAPLPMDYIIMAHNSLGRGETKTLEGNAAVLQVTELAERNNPNHGLNQLSLTGFEASTAEVGYCDPVLDGDCRHVKVHGGRRIAGLAAVGNTGFVAIVETLRDDAAHPNKVLVRLLLLWGGIPFAFCAALLSVAVWLTQRRRAWLRSTRPAA